MMSLWDALRMNMMISYQELVRTFLNLWSIYVKPTSIIDKLSSDLFCFDKAYTAATILISTLYFGFISPACTVQRTGA